MTVSRITYIEQPCKAALNRVEGMPFKWALNPYRGCAHACRYCYARITHTYLDLNAGDDFDNRIFVKVNLPAVLRRELRSPSWRRELVAVGTATDPYQPAEVRYLLTRDALAAFVEAANPFSITTKSTLVTRDLDLLQDATRLTRCSVYVSVGTLDETVWKRIEPGTPHPRKRLEAMAQLVTAGVRAGVLMAPILPGLTDRDDLMDELAAEAAAHGAQFLSAIPLRLMEGARECYLDALVEHYPERLGPTLAMYRSVNAPTSYRRQLEGRLDALRERYGLVPREDPAEHPRPQATALARHPLRPPPSEDSARQITFGL